MNVESLNLQTPNGDSTAYVARPETDARAIVILIQEWWGINDHIRDIAGRYAREGYICVAPDLYRGRLAADADEAGRMMKALALEDGVAIIRSAMDQAKAKYGDRPFGITGFCMGGTFSFRAACEIPGFSAAAAFYGDFPEAEVLSKLITPTLFIAGERDNWINPEKVSELREAARKYDLPVEIVSYDADHAFFNDTRPEVYDPEAARDAWRRVLEHFERNLRKGAAQGA